MTTHLFRSFYLNLTVIFVIVWTFTTIQIIASASETQLSQVTTFILPTTAANNRQLEFALRLPANFSNKMASLARIMVIFGGRNWPARKTLATINFNQFADQYNVILLAPGFQDNTYWQPETWSGQALVQALTYVQTKYNIPNLPIFLYGYSAGGQCANLFYAWMPERVDGWGAHACGVFFNSGLQSVSASLVKKESIPEVKLASKSSFYLAPALVTCGVKDELRYTISRHFVYSYREAGGDVIWQDYASGHELQADPLKLASLFFASLLEKPGQKPLFIGDDDTKRYYAVYSRNALRIPIELRSPFRTENLAQAWQQGAGE